MAASESKTDLESERTDEGSEKGECSETHEMVMMVHGRSFAAWYIKPSTSVDTADVQSSRTANRGLW